jgi:cytochrome P450
MKELRYATMEMLRMYSFAPVRQMVALENFEFQGFHVDAGTQLIVSQAVTHYLPELFADPYWFGMDRYKPEGADHRQSWAFALYGVGHHICLGAGFSETRFFLRWCRN